MMVSNFLCWVEIDGVYYVGYFVKEVFKVMCCMLDMDSVVLCKIVMGDFND